MTNRGTYLFDFNPSLRKIWDYEKNTLDPEIMLAKSGKKAYWLCENNHSSYTTIQSRAIGRSCALCSGSQVDVGVNDLATMRPDLVAQMVNPELATTLMVKSNKRAEWICSLGHQWIAYVSNRHNGDGCPYCAGQKVLAGFNDLATVAPELAAQMFDPNFKSTEVSGFSNRKVGWKCSLGHQWIATINKRRDKRGCPYCSNKKVLIGYNDLWTTHPELCKELLNKEDGYKVVSGSEKIFSWKCSLGHIWKGHPYDRISRNFGCPYCAGNQVLIGFNDLATINPELAKEWDDDTLSPQEVTAGSGKKVQWKCINGHIWKAFISNRSKGVGCSQCSLSQTSKAEGMLRKLIAAEFDGVGTTHLNRVPVENYLRKTRSVDIDWVEESGKHIVVEYDGCYWHQNKTEYDTTKTLNLLDNGYIVIRIREQSHLFTLGPLNIVHPNFMQLSIVYNLEDKNLVSAVDNIKDWVKSRRAEKWNSVSMPTSVLSLGLYSYPVS